MGGSDQTLLILPFNLAVSMPSEIESFSPIVWEELEVYLRAHGKQLRTVSMRDARRLWHSSIEQVRDGKSGDSAGYDEAVSVLVRELAKHAEFDAVIAPSLVIRKAHISGGTALWDGVARVLELEEDPGTAIGIRDDAPLVGEAPGASLHAVVLNRAGEKVQETVGGLDLLVRVRVLGKPDARASDPGFEFAARTDLFADRAHLREGIAVALAPFLRPLPLKAD